MVRACVACHSSKVKCVRTSDDENVRCDRCARLEIECVAHVSRQGQGPRRSRKKLKMQQHQQQETSAAAVLSAGNLLSSVAGTDVGSRGLGFGAVSSIRQTSVGSSSVSSQHSNYSGMHRLPNAFVQQQGINVSTSGNLITQNQGNGVLIKNSNSNSLNATTALSKGIASLQVEDEIVCKSIKGMDYNHFGLHHLIRMWVSLSLTRRSFNLLARASFIAAKCGMTMDDVLANKSPFAIVTNTPPMSWLCMSITCPREQQSTLGPRIKLPEVPWDLLKAVHIDLTDLSMPNSPLQRWSMMRWNTKGKCRFWASPFFERDFASVDEIERVWVENKIEVIDLFLPKTEKKKFATSVFNLLYLNKEPNMTVYVTRIRLKVRPRNTQQTLDVVLVNTLKIIDLETSIHYHEIRFEQQGMSSNQVPSSESLSSILLDMTSSDNKRRNSHLMDQNQNSDPSPLGGDVEFTDLDTTDEFEEWMNMFDDPSASIF